jgi:hypothetical protein
VRPALEQAPSDVSAPDDGQSDQGDDGHQHHGGEIAQQSVPFGSRIPKRAPPIPANTMKKLQLRIAGTMSDTGAKAMVHDALTVTSRALKNGPHLTDRVMAKNAKKAKVSKRLQKQVKAVMAHRAA